MEQEMKYIYTVYKTGSFSAAAKELFITQPALSIAVSKAEARIGMPLFDRTARPLVLTRAGELYIQKYREIRNLELELQKQLHDITELKTGELRIGGSHYIISHVLPPYLAAFTDKYPGIHLELIEAGSDSLLAMLEDHRIDLTFHCEKKTGDPFRRIPCFTDHILLAVPRSLAGSFQAAALTAADIGQSRHLAPDCPAVSLAAWKELPYILLSPGNGLHGRSMTMFSEAAAEPQIRLMTGQLTTAWHLCEAGIGATFVPDRLIAGCGDDVLFFRINSPCTTRTFDLTMSERRYISKAMETFAGMITGDSCSHPLSGNSDRPEEKDPCASGMAGD